MLGYLGGGGCCLRGSQPESFRFVQFARMVACEKCSTARRMYFGLELFFWRHFMFLIKC